MQYQAGYFLNSIFDLFLNKTNKDKVEKIVFQLGHFDLETIEELKHSKVDYISEIKVINNLLQRGLPTLPSTFIADLFSTTFGKTIKQTDALNQISHPFKDDLFSEELYKAIHVIDPRIKIENQTEHLEEEAKASGAKGKRYDFKYSFFPEFLGHYFIQLIEENRTFESIIVSSGFDETDGLKKEFEQIIKRNQDFVLEMPFSHNGQRGIAIELDDTPSETSYEYETDILKQNLSNKIGWGKPLNIETHRATEVQSQLKPLIDFTYNEYFDTIAKNFRSPLYKSSEGLTALQYALSPFAVARVEKTIIEFLLSGKLSLNDETWKIGVIERDVPCAYLAVQDLMLNFENLFALKGEQKQLPAIKLSIFNTKEFKEAKLNEIYPGDIKLIEKFDSKIEFDLLIDISVLQRSGIYNQPIKSKAKQVAVIRSVRSISTKSTFLTDKSISYLDFFSTKNDESIRDKAKDALKYFLKNVFRKDSFLPGQLELINLGLQQKNTLGLLPPLGGKTIAALLAAILQPGVTFVVCPTDNIISNQISELHKIRFGKSITIGENAISDNSSENQLKRLEESKVQIALMGSDFLRKKEFRDALLGMEFNKVFINYIIIDEAHCVSEWGHQFKPVYTKIGQLKDIVFKNSIRQPVSIIALTGTAGYSCIADIQKEFQIKSENIVSSNIKQTDISFKVLDTTSNQVLEDANFEQFKQMVGARKQLHFIVANKDIFQNDQSKKSTLIICPEANGFFGVSNDNDEGLDEKLKSNLQNVKIAAYKGNFDNANDKIGLPSAKSSLKNSIAFKNDLVEVLIATQDYGTGSNKPDIRNLVYFSPPSSLESFIQTTFRLGMDGKKSACTILMDKQKFALPEYSSVGDYFKENTISIDKYLAYEKLISKYKGKSKEIAILEQLWNGYKPNLTTLTESISDLIEENFLVEAELQFQPAKNAKRIYINSGEKTYGYIDLSTLTISTDESRFEKSRSQEILNFVVNQIKKNIQEGDNIQEVLYLPLSDGEPEPVAKTLAKMSVGSFYDIHIPFINDSIDKIQQILSKKVSTSFTKSIIRKQFNLSLSEKDFINRLEKANPLGKLGSFKEEIINLYRKAWNKQECELALYRLGKLGLLEDYQVDDSKQQFAVRLRKREDYFYKDELLSLINEYLMPENAAKERSLTEKTSNSDLYQLLLNHLDIFYNYILPVRINSIETLFSILSQIPENKRSNNDINQSCNELMNRYFVAKYANSYFSLIPGTKSLMGKQQDFETINGYLKYLGTIKENWLNLRSSAEIIKKSIPDNFVPYLLNAYADLIGGEQKPELIDEAFDQIARGFIKMRKQKNYDRDLYQSEIQSFLDVLFKNRPDLKQNYQKVLWLRMHYIWLKDFNRKQFETIT
jgi:ATP-dependent DNA helicase RecQ